MPILTLFCYQCFSISSRRAENLNISFIKVLNNSYLEVNIHSQSNMSDLLNTYDDTYFGEHSI